MFGAAPLTIDYEAETVISLWDADGRVGPQDHDPQVRWGGPMNDRELLAIMAAILASSEDDPTYVPDDPATYVNAAVALLNEADRYIAERAPIRAQFADATRPTSGSIHL